MKIRFYKLNETYGCFSNFSKHPINLDGIIWPTTEHYFQAQKYIETPRYNKIAAAETPRIAANLGRDRSLPLRSDWEDVKDEIMYKCVKAKILQYGYIKKLLVSTETAEIIEDSPIDSYWGCGKDGTGKNMLGCILMSIRDELSSSVQV